MLRSIGVGIPQSTDQRKPAICIYTRFVNSVLHTTNTDVNQVRRRLGLELV